MKKYIKNSLIILLIMIFIPLLTSCGAGGGAGAISGLPFVSYKSLIFNDNYYEVYILEDNKLLSLEMEENVGIIYKYKKMVNTESNQWTINYLDTYQFITDTFISDEFLNEFNKVISPKINEYSNYLSLELYSYDQKTIVEKEFTIINNNIYDAIYIIDLCIPFIVYDNTNYTRIYIEVPVKTIIGYEKDSLVTIDYGNDLIKEIDSNVFLTLESIIEK